MLKFRRLMLFFFALSWVVGFVCWYTCHHVFTVRYAPAFISLYANDLTEKLNTSLSNIYQNSSCRNIELVALNWLPNDNLRMPTLSDNEKKCAIIWLGSQENLLPDDLYKYLDVWASTPSLYNFLSSTNTHAVYVPLFARSFNFLTKHNSQKIIAVIGNQPLVISALQTLHVPYRQYNLYSDIEKIYNDLPLFKAVFVEKSRLSEKSLDIHPLFLDIASHEIPLFAPWTWPYEDTINLFNDTISFYTDEQNIIDNLKRLFAQEPIFYKRTQKAAKLVQREFSLNRQLKRLSDKHSLSNSSLFLPSASRSLNIDIPTAVGHYVAGDYALAQDLAQFLDDITYYSSLTFYNSLYKYPAETNILLRGFLPPATQDLNANFNILYLAYAQFAQSETQEFLPTLDEFLNSITQTSQSLDAVVVASDKIFSELNAKGVSAYYIPQFTNSSRFYPDFDASLKSDVLFVGANTFYRTAVPALLKHGIPVDVYGPYWPDGVAKASYADNRILRKYYSSAKIVLNDTREGMKQFGFISNRIFDASACGTLVISDYMPEIEQIYGDAVPMYRSESELIDLVKYYLTHDDERRIKAQKAQEITLKNFTAQQAAEKFHSIIENVQKTKPAKN